MGIRKNTKEFIKDAINVHGGKYDYSLVDYKGAKTNVIIKCKEHDVFTQLPTNHLKGHGCPICVNNISVSTIEYIKKCKLQHGDKYDYSLVNYKNNKSKVKIICKEHDVFEQRSSSHLIGHGCPKCKKSSRKFLSNNEFVEKAKNIHGNKYNYSLVDYKGCRIKVNIICLKHGVFSQRATNHLSGQGCPLCKNNIISKKQKNNPSGWGLSDWVRMSKKSKRFDSFKVYIIRCWNDTEQFYKIGRTFMTTDRRFIQFPYNYEIIEELVFDNAKDAHKKETNLKRLNKQYKYVPKIFFDGMYECFSELNFDLK